MIATSFSLLSLGTLWALYWALVRPFILDRIDTSFEELRSRTEWALIDGLPEAETRPASELAAHLESSPEASSLSMSVLVYVLWRNRKQVTALEEKDRVQFANAPVWVRETYKADIALTTGAALANSPLWWPVVAAVLLIAYFSAKTARWWDDLQNAAMFTRAERFGGLAT